MSGSVIIDYLMIGLVLHGVLLAAYLLFQRNASLKILSLLFFSISIILFEYTYYGIAGFASDPTFIAIKIPFFYTLGPLVFLYLKADVGRNLSKKDSLHFLPFLIVFILLSSYYFQAEPQKVVDANSAEGDWKRTSYQWLNLIQLIVYSVLGLKLVKAYKLQRTLKSMVYVFSTLTIAYLISLVVATALASEMRFYYSVLLGIALNLLAYTALNRLKNQKIKVERNVDAEWANTQMRSILQFLERERPYLNPDYKIQNMADDIGSNTKYISTAINFSMQKSFSDFINEYRINEAKRLLISDPSMKVFAVALESGFGNKSNFLRVFKKHLGQSPTEFKKMNKSGHNS